MYFDKMKIPPTAIKKYVNKTLGFSINNEAANELSKMLGKRVAEIAKQAVERAKRRKSKLIDVEDIQAYKFKGPE